ncbi:hypothetical protein Syun_009756 [Stephania yunnanensis]|uniref:Uncharacterized protein n=1 Tax=Stephania yunnanensis TaxID=152371 RepID=A0AAP0PPC0_9MAGN
MINFHNKHLLTSPINQSIPHFFSLLPKLKKKQNLITFSLSTRTLYSPSHFILLPQHYFINKFG